MTVHYVQDGKVGASVRADEDPILYWRHVITPWSSPASIPACRERLVPRQASLLGLLQGDQVLA